jgi:hypothetical protein
MSQVVGQEALTRLLVEKGIFSKEKFLEMVKGIDRERKRDMNMSAHHVREGIWVDLHISKVLYQPKDRPTFNEFIKTIRFKEER